MWDSQDVAPAAPCFASGRGRLAWLLSSALAHWLASNQSVQNVCWPPLQDEESEVASAESRRRTAEEEALNADFEKNVVIM